MANGQATVLMPGTCGELVQGMMGDQHFLVSCPIDMFSTITVNLRERGGVAAAGDAPKAVAALRATLRYFGEEGLGATLAISSPLPRSKGMGSSTADVAGTIFATAMALGRTIPDSEVARICLSIEPTDSSLFPHLALFDHREGKVCQELEPPPAADILVLDLGGEVDTLAYNSVDRTDLLRQLEPQAREALRLVCIGIAQSDLGLLGRGATLSALAHQKVLPKPHLERVIALAQEVGAVGVNVGHSGTVVGVLFPQGKTPLAEVSLYFKRGCPNIERVFACHLIGGGPRSQEQAVLDHSGELAGEGRILLPSPQRHDRI